MTESHVPRPDVARESAFAESGQDRIPILLVEDDAGDVLMTQEAFEHHRIPNPLHVVGDGAEALRFLRREGEHATAARPGMILLDLNLPKVNGREVLATIKTDEDLSTIPVVVLTTSAAEEDVERSYKLHANAFVTKPVDLTRFMDVIRQIDEFFVTVARLPVS
ncbi:response regulator [Pseudonocardia sp. GCM10023141]|uniref:response regulator n=1 Tax=Pseudonocardia sp. GCM10023141 TaxID=3252653 RepID=UPI00361C058E